MGKKRKKVKERKRRKKIFFLFVFIIVLISIVGVVWYLQSIQTPTPTPTGTLIIHVVDEYTNNTISGATITIVGPYSTTGQSNEQGEYMFESIPVGTYSVWAIKEGFSYEVEAETATVEAGKTTHHTFKLHTPD